MNQESAVCAHRPDGPRLNVNAVLACCTRSRASAISPLSFAKPRS